MQYQAGHIQIAVVGAGHAGVEAALAAARLGCSTMLFTLSLDAVANMPCNPSIGGTAKGHLVREIDALGGEMGKAADKTFLQSRMLNRGKGPAVHSLRAQIDRRAYMEYMKHTIERQENLTLKQAEIAQLLVQEGKVTGVVTSLGAVYTADRVILATGTYLKGKIYVGDVSYQAGPDNQKPADLLSQSLAEAGIRLRRFKTGTPARVKRSSINFTNLEVQEGDEKIVPFSFETTGELCNTEVCHITYTNSETHRVIMENLQYSPLYSGMIEGIGPRYCPSIEDKVVRFADKPRHQIFIEPMGRNTEEMYIQGMSSSLPEQVQIALYRTVEGLEQAEFMRTAYAIEYDCIDPLDLRPTLEFMSVSGLYGAGQFNGTSGYEEAAAQGLIAGINAARSVQGKGQIILERSNSYIGTLIDDLVTKGCMDPYRMMTSRSEYRLLLRQDNADTRLTKLGYEIGLIGEERYQRFLKKSALRDAEIARVKATTLAPSPELNALLVSHETSPLVTGARIADIIRRPQRATDALAPVDPGRPDLPEAVAAQVAVEIKYEGYIKKQLDQVERMRKLEETRLAEDMDYGSISGLRLEAREKLLRVRPHSLGQASRISGVSPADISVLIIYLEQQGRETDD